MPEWVSLASDRKKIYRKSGEMASIYAETVHSKQIRADAAHCGVVAQSFLNP
jgi:hypothetical protein